VAARPTRRGRASLITIPWDPDLVIGSVHLAWHSIFAFVALLIGSFLSIRLARYLIRDQRVYAFSIAVIVGGLIGARIAHVVDNWPIYQGDVLKIVSFAGGGIGTMGAPLGSTIAGYLACRALRLPVGFMFDITVVGIALGETIGRFGDIVNGEHHGTACAAPLGICASYTSPVTLGQLGPVHFIGLYDSLLMLAVFLVLWRYWHRVRGHSPEGRVWALYLVLFGLGRFVESFVRQDPVVALGLQEAHFLGLAYALAGAGFLAWAHRQRPKRAETGRVSH
jgi:phosphatidylglycerol:prolipoprotein diacylglycerol transferase